MQVRDLEFECKELNTQVINDFLVPALKQAPEGSVFSLNLSACRLSCKPDNSLVLVLEHLSQYRFDTLSLQLTEINQEVFFPEIVKFLAKNPHIRKLDLSHNQISDPQFLALFCALKENIELEELDVSHNAISEAIIPALQKQKRQQPCARKINLIGNNLSDNQVMDAQLALRKTHHNKKMLCDTFFYKPANLDPLPTDLQLIVFNYM